jgi:hypothetical protein
VTSILAERMEWSAIVGGLLGGRIVVHEIGTFVEMELRDLGGRSLGGIGDAVVGPPASVVFRLHGRSPREQEVRLYFAGVGSCTERRQPGRDVAPRVDKQVLFRQSVCSAAACDFEFEVEVGSEAGLYFATVGDFETQGLNTRDVALTNALAIRQP